MKLLVSMFVCLLDVFVIFGTPRDQLGTGDLSGLFSVPDRMVSTQTDTEGAVDWPFSQLDYQSDDIN